jgi:hypothetical protein
MAVEGTEGCTYIGQRPAKRQRSVERTERCGGDRGP